MSQKNYSLSELTSHIEKVIKVNFDEPLWIRAEISELREKNGHCYMELIEKDETNDTLKARVKASIWASTFRLLKPYFEESTNQQLRPGLSVLIAATVEYHGLYGISLNIKDIDPTFTLGAQAKRRLEIIRQLESDGVMDMNKSIEFPLLPQRLAIISSATAAGYEDFMNQLHQHPSNFAFYTRLFPAIMQGDQASSSIIGCLEEIFSNIEMFDVVILIRGGGASTDLACFDDYELALNCAQFPLPIIAGIGHQRDLSIVDMVVHSSVKTPTAAAALLTDTLSELEEKVVDLHHEVCNLASSIVAREQQKIADIRWKIKNALHQKSRDKFVELEQLKMRMKSKLYVLLNQHENQLKLYQSAIERHSPAAMLKYGYTITSQAGLRITSVQQLQPNIPITTLFPDGQAESMLIPEE